MTTANQLTFARLLISPLFMVVYIAHDALGISSAILPYVLLVLLGISELSDAFDGFIARKYNQVTDLGKVLDPMADSITKVAVFLSLTKPPVKLPILLVFIFIYRDAVISTLRTICAMRGFALAARTSGKIKSAIQALVAFVILFLMIPESMGTLKTETLQSVSAWLAGAAGLYTIFSACDYFYANRHYITKMLTNNDVH